MRSLHLTLLCLALTAPATAQQAAGPDTTPLTDPQLAQMTGKFLLPNGVELALSVVSDTVVDGQLVLRTVLTVDKGSQVQVFGREAAVSGTTYAGASGATHAAAPTGVTVTLDRQSGLQTVTPTYGVAAAGASNVSVGASAPATEALGLSVLPATVGGAAVATADGAVTVAAVPSGTQVTLVGDQFSVSNLVGRSVATALVNSASDRTFDTVTNVGVDLRNVAPFQAGSAQIRVDALALDAARGMVR